jgi:hypothetical protein
MSDRAQRNHPDYLYYLGATRFLLNALHLPEDPAVLHVVLPPLNPPPPKYPGEDELCAEPRSVLVRRIVALNPELDSKILSRLQIPKLARMLARLQQEQIECAAVSA